MTLLRKPTGRGNVRGLTPKSEKRGKLRRQEKHDRGNTLCCSLAASDKGSYDSDSESPDDLIPNNILRAQTTRKRTASVITAIRWNTL